VIGVVVLTGREVSRARLAVPRLLYKETGSIVTLFEEGAGRHRADIPPSPRMAALFVILALAGCASVAVGPGQAPTRPISKAILATPAECTDRRAGQASPSSEPGPARPSES
jgi:hypothetical protein